MCSGFISMFSFSCAKVINESIKEDLLQGPKLEEDLIRCAEYVLKINKECSTNPYEAKQPNPSDFCSYSGYSKASASLQSFVLHIDSKIVPCPKA